MLLRQRNKHETHRRKNILICKNEDITQLNDKTDAPSDICVSYRELNTNNLFRYAPLDLQLLIAWSNSG